MNKYNAEEDIRLIKNILNKTQQDISSVGSLFIWIGIINLLVELLKNIGYNYFKLLENIPRMLWDLLRFMDVFGFLTICIVYFIYFAKVCKRGNDISKSIIKLWGILLIGGKLFIKIFLNIFMATQGQLPDTSMLVLDKVLNFVFVSMGFLLFGIIIHNTLITGGTLTSVVLYCFFLKMNKLITVAVIHNNEVTMYMQDAFWLLLMSVGMIVCGIYIRMNRR